MNDILAALRRRWLFAVLGLVVVALAGGLTLRQVAPTYVYTSTVLLLPPEVSRVVDPTTPDYTRSNPLFFLGSLTQTRDILIGAMTSKDQQDAVAEEFPDISYAAAPDVMATAPVVVLTVESSSATQGAQAVQDLTSFVPNRLDKLQSDLGIQRSARITSHTLILDETPELARKGQIRSVAVVVGGLLLLLLFLIGALDSLLLARAARRRARHDEPAIEPVVESTARRDDAVHEERVG